MKKVSSKAYVCAFCIAAASNFGFSGVYAYTSYYVAFQTATGFTNTQLGLLITVLGIASTILYIPGGFIADRFDPVKLTAIGLIGAGAVSFGIAAFPSYPVMMLLYVAFAVFAVLIAWSPQMIMLRMVSADDQQAKIQTMRAYGRTLPILIISLVGSGLLAMLQELAALRVTLIMYGVLAIVFTIIALVTYEPVNPGAKNAEKSSLSLNDFATVLKMPEVWAIGLLGFSAYTASSGVTYLQPYMADMFGMTASTTSVLAVLAKNCALIAAPILTAIAAKAKIPVTKALGLGLCFSALCFVVFMFLPQNTGILVLAIIFYMAAALCIMATWALQFTPVSEVGIPMAITGSAIGVVSMVTFVSDIFFSALCGHFIDKYAMSGYKMIFALTVVILLAGALAARYVVKKINANAKAAPASGETLK